MPRLAKISFWLLIFLLVIIMQPLLAQDTTPELPPPQTSEVTLEASPEILTETPTVTATETATATLEPTAEAVLPTVETTAEVTTEQTESVIPAQPEITNTVTESSPLLPEPPLTPVLSEAFHIGDLSRWNIGTGWELVPQEQGFALQVTNSDTPVSSNVGVYDDVAVELLVQSETGTFHLHLRDAYTLTLYPTGQVDLYRGTTLLTTTTVAMSNTWRHVRFSAMGDTLRVAIDNVEIIALRDTEPTLTAGQIAFNATFPEQPGNSGQHHNILLVDNIRFWIPESKAATATSTPSLTPIVQLEQPAGPAFEQQADTATPTYTPTATSTPPDWCYEVVFTAEEESRGEWQLKQGTLTALGVRSQVVTGFTGVHAQVYLTADIAYQWQRVETEFHLATGANGSATDDIRYIEWNTDLSTGRYDWHDYNIPAGTGIATYTNPTVSPEARRVIMVLGRGNHTTDEIYIRRVRVFGNNPAPQGIPDNCGAGSVTPTPTNTLTPTPTSTPTATATPTATNTPTNPTLADFGIELEGTWSTEEQQAILTAAMETGQALSARGAAPNAVDAFREVLQGMNGMQFRRIKFTRASLSGTFCTTAKNPTSDYSASIDCDSDLVMTQYTAVHEFGHVLVGRTTVNGDSAYLSFVQDPNGPGGGPLRDLAPIPSLVMGRRSYNLKIGFREDWQRSDVIMDNGWGSAALWDQQSYFQYEFPDPPAGTATPFPLHVPQIGPCGPGAPTLPVVDDDPYFFQQNPCTFPDWETSDPVGPITEQEEAAADMFLNWVYWKNYGNNTAFLDQHWRFSGANNCYPNGCSDPGLSGQARSTWMDQTMANLFTQFGW